MSQTAVALLRAQYASAHEWLEGTMGDVTNEVANYVPPGRTATAGAHYIHHVHGEDALINWLLRGTAPLARTTFDGRTGASELPPAEGDWFDWGRKVRVDVASARAYARAVYESTDGYLATLSDPDLETNPDLSPIGLPEMTLGSFLGGMLLINAGAHCGEISTIKGLQGLQGYPF
jgi:hypothetical protein